MDPSLILLVIVAAVVVVLMALASRSEPDKPNSAQTLLTERRAKLIARRTELQQTRDPSEGKALELDRVLNELEALEQRIATFAQMHEVIQLFSSHDDLDALISSKESKSKLYWLVSLTLFVITASVAAFIAINAYLETYFWVRLIELTGESKAAFFFSTLPLSYSLVLALLFMRFHHKVQGELAPLSRERGKWLVVYKILVASEIVGATEPTEKLVLETFLQLRSLALKSSESDQANALSATANKESGALGTPLENLSRLLQSVAGARSSSP